MSEAATWSYRPGSWFAVVGSATTLLLPAAEKARVGELWARIDDGEAFDAILDALLQTGLGRLSDFVLVGGDGTGPTRVLLRGGTARASVEAGGETVELDGTQAATWVERTFDDVTRLTVTLDDAADGGDGGDGADLPTLGGLARVGRLDRPPFAPEPEPEPEPEAEHDAGAAPFVAAAVPVGDTDADADADSDTGTAGGWSEESTDEPQHDLGDQLTGDQPAGSEPSEAGLDAPGEPFPVAEGVVVPDDEVAGTAEMPLAPPPPPYQPPSEEPAPFQDEHAAEPTDEPADVEAADHADEAGQHVGDADAHDEQDEQTPAGLSPFDWPDEDAEQESSEQPGEPEAPAGGSEWSTPSPSAQWPAPPPPPPGTPPSPVWGPDDEASPQQAAPTVFGSQEMPPAEDAAPPPPPADWQQSSDWQQDQPAQQDWQSGQQDWQQPEQPEPSGQQDWQSAPPPPPPGTDHDGLTRAGVVGEEFARQQPGIPGQPMAPSVTDPVAKLIISNGEVVEVDRVILIGRAPEARRFTATDQPRLVTVPSPLHEISSTHVEVRPGSGADHGSAVVTDMGSTNGTVLEQPGLGAEELKPGIAVQLIPGAVINLGDGVTIQVTHP